MRPFDVVDVLARGANFEITSAEGVARCNVINSPGVDKEEGARCAAQMREVLLLRVLGPVSSHRALVFDVTRGPEVFGPVTRALLEEIFRAAEQNKRRIAVRINGQPMQKLQFTSLCRDCAATRGRVVETDDQEREWIERRPSGAPA